MNELTENNFLPAEDAPTPAPIHILLIEDNKNEARYTIEVLRRSMDRDHHVDHLTTLGDALDWLNEHQPTVILLDMSLPDGEGLENVLAVQAVAPQTPVIILTNQDDVKLEGESFNAGAQDYILKNEIHGKSLMRALRHAIERTRILGRLRKAHALEKYLTFHDALTGLPNRQLFLDRLQIGLIKAHRNEEIVGILLLDLHGFKRINDALGHGVGDELLKNIGDRIKSHIRESDTLARLSGDEFAIILEKLSKEQDVVSVARKILNCFSRPVVLRNEEFFLSASVGISVYPGDGNDAESLIQHAGIARTRAKAQGKNNFQLYNLSMDAWATRHLALENRLYRAVENEELRLFYQPIISLPHCNVVSMEALLRWQHPQYGLLSPDKFIPLAEESGLIGPIGDWVLQRACEQNVLLQADGFPPIRVAVNLAAQQFRDNDLHEKVLMILEKTGLAPENLGLEITESNIMQDVEYSIKALELLKDIGVEVSIDDFGTGYSSLSYLKRFPIDVLKIDRSFINGIPEDHNDKSITSAIIFLAHNLGLQVLAEGVESRRQLSFLKSMRCNEAQGYFFSRPLAFDDLQRFLQKYKSEAGARVVENPV